MKILSRLTITFLTAAALFSCAQEKDESSESVQNRILEAYVSKYYPDATRTESGMYLIDSIPGTGRTPDKESYALVDYIVSYLDGSYSSYTFDSVAKQLGTYTHSGYYQPHVWALANNTTGIQEMLGRMKEGGMLKAIVPATLLDEESGSEIVQGDGSSKIYELYLREVIDDPYLYQINLLEEYAYTRYNSLDSTEYGFYFSKTVTTEDSVESTTHVNLRYIGKFLNGTVFDTNIQDTAKKYRIYTSGNTYEASSFQHYDSEDEAMTSNSFIGGFSKAANRLNYGEKAIAFFYSSLGYGDTGNSDIPGYVPLFFEIWVEEPEEE